MATTNLDFRKIDYDQLIDRPITRTSANVDTIKTAGVYDRGDGKRFLVIVDDNTITQIEESYNGYRTRTSTDGGLVRGAWTTAEFSDTNAKRDVVVISGTEPVSKRETTAWIDTSDGNKFKVYDGTEWLEVSGQSIQTEEMPTASEELEGKIIQYEGSTTSTFTHGYFYECVGDGGNPEEFSWVNIKVQDAPGQAETMPVPSADNVGQIIQYTGDTNEYYTHAHFYEVVEDSGTYSWSEVKTQSVDAEIVSYDGTTSGLTATNVQDAIDEMSTVVEEIKDIVEVETMPTPSEDSEGTIIQYKGATTSTFTHGYFYECVGDGQDPETFSRVNIQVQDNPSQAEVMPTPSAENVGQIIQYAGDTNNYYTHAHFYEVIEDPENPGQYIYKEVEVQNSPAQAEEMPEASEENEGKIIQYQGETDSNFTHGYFYECVEIAGSDPAEYEWINVQVQDGSTSSGTVQLTQAQYDELPSSKLSDGIDYEIYITGSVSPVDGQPIQLDSLPTASAEYVGAIHQYVGGTTLDYTKGYFYICSSDGGVPETYSWEQIDVQPAGGPAGGIIFYLTQSQYNSLPSSDKEDPNKHYYIIGSGGLSPVPSTSVSAADVYFDNTGTSLESTDVQSAIEEISNMSPQSGSTISLVTTEEYNNLPSSKESDGVFYFIYE